MVTRKEYMTQMERLRNERSEEICKQFLTLKEENAGFKPWRIIGIIARELEVSTQTVFNTLKAQGVYVSKGVLNNAKVINNLIFNNMEKEKDYMIPTNWDREQWSDVAQVAVMVFGMVAATFVSIVIFS